MLTEKRIRISFAKIKMVLFLILLVEFQVVFSQQPDFEFKPFEALSDITSSKTTVIAEDSIGYLWIGTEEGLFRFDGQTVFSYHQDIKNPKSLPSNGINNLVIDRNDNLWFGTKNGICKYNREYDDFTLVPDKSEMKGFENCFIKVFAIDKTGQLFVAYNQIIYAYDQSEEKFSKVVKLDRGDISCMVFDDQNNLWIGTLTNGGLFCFDRKNKQLIPFLNNPLNSQSISVNEIKTLALSATTLWIGTLGKGIDAYDLKNKTFKHYFSSKNLENYIKSIFISKDQRVWVCTLCNFRLFIPETGSFYNYNHDPENPYSVGKSMEGIYEDRAGNFWTINPFGGIRLIRKNIPFKHPERNANNFWTTSEKITTAMAHDGLGQLWIGNYTSGIEIHNWQNFKTINLQHEVKNKKNIPEGIIFSIFRDSKKQMWVGSYLGGLQKFNPKTNDFDSYWHNPDNSFSIACNDVRSIAEDSNGNLWLAVHRQGVDRFDVREKKFYHYNLKNNHLCDQYTNQVFVDSRDNLWVATAWGLGFLQKGEQLFKNYRNNINDTTSISSNEIQTIYEDKLGNIWVGTNEGLNKFNYETQKFSRFSSGLKNKHIASILSDKNNNIWVSTITSISRFNPTTLQFTNYNQNYGIQSKEFCDRSCCVDSTGTLYFGGSAGYDFFCPDSLKEEARKPTVILTDFKLFNKSISSRKDSKILDRHISYAKKISLSYFQNAITFFYQALSLTEANKIEYEYKLEGFDKDWVYTGNGREANYTNLNPGKYTFRVKAKFGNGDWNTKETTIDLYVHPAWWMTTLFKILVVLIVLVSIFAYVYFRIKRLQNQSKKLTELVDERTKEIKSKNELLETQAMTLEQNNEELKNLNSTKNKLFALISHDLRGPFNVILGYQNMLADHSNDFSEKERREMIRKTYSTSQKVYYLVENLLSWARIQTSSIQYKPVLFNVKQTFIEKLDLYLNIAEAKGIKLDFQFPDGLFAFGDIDLVEAILRNLISNAVKFTPGGGTIQVTAIQQNDVIKISVIDSGTGMTAEQIDNVFNPEKTQTKRGTDGEKGSGLGLILCKEFVEINKGTILVESQPDKGSTFSFTMPAFNPENQQSGDKILG